jgi:hypothetical protein
MRVFGQYSRCQGSLVPRFVDSKTHERLWQVTCVLEINNINVILLIEHEVVQIEIGEGEEDLLALEVDLWWFHPVWIVSF